MTREEAIEVMKAYRDKVINSVSNQLDGDIKAFEMAIQALSRESCDDAISRILKKMWNCRGKHTTSIDKVAMEQIIRDELPSVTQKSGKWIRTPLLTCDRCNKINKSGEETDYCPNCGAKMVEPQEAVDSLVKVSQG